MIVHMKPSLVREQIQYLQRLIRYMEEEELELKRALQRLQFAWKGPSADEFIMTLHQCLRTWKGAIDELEYLLILLQREVEKWEKQDQQGALRWKRLRT